MLHLQNKAWSELSFFFAVLKKLFLIVIRGSKQCQLYLSNEKLSTQLFCDDPYYVNMYLINVQLCVKLRVGWHPARPAILLNKEVFPIGQSGKSSPWRVCYQQGLPHLVIKFSSLVILIFYWTHLITYINFLYKLHWFFCTLSSQLKSSKAKWTKSFITNK